MKKSADLSLKRLRDEKKTCVKKILSILIILAGVGLLAYPWISNWLFEHRTQSIVNSYQRVMEDTDEKQQEEMLRLAEKYNECLVASKITLMDPFMETDEKKEVGLEYKLLLNFDKTGLMGSIEIPCISVNLPIWHGTDATTLEKGIGHLEGSSLPVGGKGTHSILTGHTGLSAAKLFTDLTEMKEGDVFFLHIGIRDMAYEVMAINVIMPEDTGNLLIDKNKDLVTLVTCTPYGMNTHRLCVTGKRTEYTEKVRSSVLDDQDVYDASWMYSYLKAIMIGIGLSILLLVIITRIRRKKEKII